MALADPVSPQTTVVVILGASAFPRSAPHLESNVAFANSAQQFRRYMRDEDGFNLPDTNLLDMFDTPKPPSEVLEEIANFLTSKQAEMKERGGTHDLVLYYSGHGGFTPTREYFLALRATRYKMESGTSLRMSDLAATIKENARNLRRYIILDCCFSGAAFKEFQSAPLTAARVQTIDSFPKEGTTLLCSSNARTVSVAPEGAKYTMFSGALLQALQEGAAKIETPLSMEQLGSLIKELIRDQYSNEAVRPEVLSPDQRVEDIALVPIFPNAATRPRHIKYQIESLVSQVSQTTAGLVALASRTSALENDVKALSDLPVRIEAVENQFSSERPGHLEISDEWEREQDSSRRHRPRRLLQRFDISKLGEQD